MTVKLGTGSGAIDLSKVMIGGVAASKIMVGTGSSAVQAWAAGLQFTDELDALSAFTVTSNGSGISISSGQAQWGGTTDGNGTALFNTGSPASTDRYAAITVGSTVSSNRYSGVILCTDAARTRSYAASFSNSAVWFKDTTGSGNWFAGAATDLATASVTVSAGSLIEVWNIGNFGYVAVNGTTVINGVALDAAKLSASYNKQGFGLYRSSFGNSSPIASWRGGDASAWGKS